MWISGKVEEAERLFKDCLQKAEQEQTKNGINSLSRNLIPTHNSTLSIQIYWELDSEMFHSFSFDEFFSFRRDEISCSTIVTSSW
jgi:ribosome modulation factor